LLAFDFLERRSLWIRSSSSIMGLLIGSPEGTFVRVIPQRYSAAERITACSYTSICAIQALYSVMSQETKKRRFSCVKLTGVARFDASGADARLLPRAFAPQPSANEKDRNRDQQQQQQVQRLK